MLKIVYPTCCGMDVHKSFIFACIASTDEKGVTTYKSKRFSTFTRNLCQCVDWLAENNCKDVCMESTGKFWIPIYNILEKTCTSEVLQEYSWEENGQKGREMDCRYFQTRLNFRQFYSTPRYSSATIFDEIPMETHQF